MIPFWVCYVEESDGGRGYRHETLQSAKTEALRLANLVDNKGKRVCVLQSVGYMQIPIEDRWHPVTLPF